MFHVKAYSRAELFVNRVGTKKTKLVQKTVVFWVCLFELTCRGFVFFYFGNLSNGTDFSITKKRIPLNRCLLVRFMDRIRK